MEYNQNENASGALLIKQHVKSSRRVQREERTPMIIHERKNVVQTMSENSQRKRAHLDFGNTNKSNIQKLSNINIKRINSNATRSHPDKAAQNRIAALQSSGLFCFG